MPIVRESNAIGTTMLRADFLSPAALQPFRSLLSAYARVRFQRDRAVESASERSLYDRRSEALQLRLWNLIAPIVGRSDATRAQLALVRSLNATIDLTAEESAALRARVPASVIALVAFSILVSGALVGAAYSGRRQLHWGVLLLAIFIAAIGATIVDLDRPSGGLITLDLAPLARQAASARASAEIPSAANRHDKS